MLFRSETRSHTVSWGLPQHQECGWDHLGVLLSIVYRLVGCLFGQLVMLAEPDLSKDAELLVLRHGEPRAATSAQRPPPRKPCRPALACALSRLVSRHR